MALYLLFVLLVSLATAHPYNTMVRVGRSYNPQAAGMMMSPYNRYYVSQYERDLPQKRSVPMEDEWEVYPVYGGFVDYYDY